MFQGDTKATGMPNPSEKNCLHYWEVVDEKAILTNLGGMVKITRNAWVQLFEDSKKRINFN
ncbi:MAG: hypothetical protein COV45_08620 [Deltaproteobacteria bacterium CG11_big_fil_rev_8_21_14_0_20_47_16]|nr:MAG: hypothetical protein COV45_08620 [Deltaproteobacteria bacterium CG11_big_fil_rev_8_21_14_0_20_47_16]